MFLIPKNSKTRQIVISGKCVCVMILVTINFSEWLLYMHNGYKNVHRPDTRGKNAPGLRSNNTYSIYTSDKFWWARFSIFTSFQLFQIISKICQNNFAMNLYWTQQLFRIFSEKRFSLGNFAMAFSVKAGYIMIELVSNLVTNAMILHRYMTR